MFTIRIAKLSDALKLSELSERTFRDSYAEVNSVEDMNIHCESNFSESIQAKEISSPQNETLVVEEKGEFVGYALLQWGSSPACVQDKSSSEILRLYVDKKWHGKGLAQDLMSACLSQMKIRKFNVVWLGVWENNLRAISFYKQFNFKEVGEHVFSLGKDPQRDIIMVRQL